MIERNTELLERLRAMPSSFDDARETMDEAAEYIEGLEAVLRQLILSMDFDEEPTEQ